MVVKYSRRAAMLTALIPALAPAFDGISRNIVTVDSPAPGLRRFVVTCGEFVQVVLHFATVAEAVAEAEEYRQATDDLAIWEGGRLVATLSAPIASRPFDLGGYALRVVFLPDGSRSDDPDLIGHVRAENGGLFAIIDATSPERKAAIQRYEDGHRDDTTVNLALAI